jgi:hypothetical protein
VTARTSGTHAERQGLLDLHAYCDNPRCSVRAVEVRVKDYDDTLLDGPVPKCPLCQRPLLRGWEPGYPARIRVSVAPLPKTRKGTP